MKKAIYLLLPLLFFLFLKRHFASLYLGLYLGLYLKPDCFKVGKETFPNNIHRYYRCGIDYLNFSGPVYYLSRTQGDSFWRSAAISVFRLSISDLSSSFFLEASFIDCSVFFNFRLISYSSSSRISFSAAVFSHFALLSESLVRRSLRLLPNER